MFLCICVELTDHGGIQERGDVEDFVQSHGRVDAFVFLASAERATKSTREGETSVRGKIFAATKCKYPEVQNTRQQKMNSKVKYDLKKTKKTKALLAFTVKALS